MYTFILFDIIFVFFLYMSFSICIARIINSILHSRDPEMLTIVMFVLLQGVVALPMIRGIESIGYYLQRR